MLTYREAPPAVRGSATGSRSCGAPTQSSSPFPRTTHLHCRTRRALNEASNLPLLFIFGSGCVQCRASSDAVFHKIVAELGHRSLAVARLNGVVWMGPRAGWGGEGLVRVRPPRGTSRKHERLWQRAAAAWELAHCGLRQSCTSCTCRRPRPCCPARCGVRWCVRASPQPASLLPSSRARRWLRTSPQLGGEPGHACHLLRVDLLLVPADIHVLDACDSDACARQRVGIRCHGIADGLDLSDLSLHSGKARPRDVSGVR